MRIYTDRQLPAAWIVGDLAGDLWIVPGRSAGWRDRREYKIKSASSRRARLREVASCYGLGLGLPPGRMERRTSALILGEQLRARRLALGWTQARLAAATGCPRPNLSDYERGTAMPTDAVLAILLAALGMAS